jgi:hypothetical protein
MSLANADKFLLVIREWPTSIWNAASAGRSRVGRLDASSQADLRNVVNRDLVTLFLRGDLGSR